MSHRAVAAIRWTARLIATAAAGFWLFIGLVQVFAELELGPKPFPWQSAVLATLIVFAAVATAIAWWRERVGGPLVLAAGIAHAVFALIAAGRNHLLAVAITGGPFLFSGVLFLVLRWRRTVDS